MIIFAASRQTIGGPIEFPFGFWVFPGDYRSGRFFFAWSADSSRPGHWKTKKHEDRPRAFLLEMEDEKRILSSSLLGHGFFRGELRVLVGGLDVNLAQQLVLDLARAVGHEVGSLVVFREGDHLADAVLAGDEHGDSVEAEGKAAVRRRAETERVKKVAE